jgi:hypothetical protein
MLPVKVPVEAAVNTMLIDSASLALLAGRGIMGLETVKGSWPVAETACLRARRRRRSSSSNKAKIKRRTALAPPTPTISGETFDRVGVVASNTLESVADGVTDATGDAYDGASGEMAELHAVAVPLDDDVLVAVAVPLDDEVLVAEAKSLFKVDVVTDAVAVDEVVVDKLLVVEPLAVSLEGAVLDAVELELTEDTADGVALVVSLGISDTELVALAAAVRCALGVATGDALSVPHALRVRLDVDVLVAVAKRLLVAVGDSDGDAHDDDVALLDAVDVATGDMLPVPVPLVVAEPLAVWFVVAVPDAVARELSDAVAVALDDEVAVSSAVGDSVREHVDVGNGEPDAIALEETDDVAVAELLEPVLDTPTHALSLDDAVAAEAGASDASMRRILWLLKSATNTLPVKSTATPIGRENSAEPTPSVVPDEPPPASVMTVRFG